MVHTARPQPGRAVHPEHGDAPLLDISNARPHSNAPQRRRRKLEGSAAGQQDEDGGDAGAAALNPPQAHLSSKEGAALRPTRAKRPARKATETSAQPVEPGEPAARAARKVTTRKLSKILGSPDALGKAVRDRDLATPMAKVCPRTAATPARSTRGGLMARMQAAAERRDLAGPTPILQRPRMSRVGKVTNQPSVGGLGADDAGDADRVSDTESDRGGSGKEDEDAFVLHRGGATEMGELASRMRGLALERAVGVPQGDGEEEEEGRKAMERLAVVLVLDAQLQALPWESLPGLRDQRCDHPSLGSCFMQLCQQDIGG